MTKNGKTAVVKGRETKLNKKSQQELIDIILKKDKVEHKLADQIKTLKNEVNTLQTIKNDGEEELAVYKDKIKALNRQLDFVMTESKDNFDLYIKECKQVQEITNIKNTFKTLSIVMIIIAFVAMIVAIL